MIACQSDTNCILQFFFIFRIKCDRQTIQWISEHESEDTKVIEDINFVYDYISQDKTYVPWEILFTLTFYFSYCLNLYLKMSWANSSLNVIQMYCQQSKPSSVTISVDCVSVRLLLTISMTQLFVLCRVMNIYFIYLFTLYGLWSWYEHTRWIRSNDRTFIT